MKDIKVGFAVHVDAVAGWLGSYGGEDSPSDIQRGLFAGEVGVPRLAKLFRERELPSSWFIPGHSIETFPKQVEAVASAGFEIGVHGYSHENPVAMTPQQEEDVLARCVELVRGVTGSNPKGYSAPWWEMSEMTGTLLQKYGFSYDHSNFIHDFLPFWVRVGDRWTNIDYEKEASEWMKPLTRGKLIDLVGIGANWYLDDLPPMMNMKQEGTSSGWVNPHDLEQIWMDQFDWVYREQDYGTFAFTIHPDVSGRPQVLLMLERVIEHISKHDGVSWVTISEMAEDFRRRYPYPGPDGSPFMPTS